MKQQIKAEAQVLDRIMHLLEENSVKYLTKNDSRFAGFIDQLYSELSAEERSLFEHARASLF